MQTFEIIALVVSGLFVGFINTLAGGGTIISFTVLMLLGLPANVANGTNRVPIIFQNIVAVRNFKKKKILDTSKALALGIPTVIGSILGSLLVINIDQQMIEMYFGIIMLVMLFFLIYNPSVWLKGKEDLIKKKTPIWMMVIFFLIGIYGGVIHVGIGYFLLIGLVLGAGYDLVRANAMKNLLVLLYVPFTLVVFIKNDQVRWDFGLTHAIGNIIGAYIASKWASEWGANFVRWMLVFIIFFSSLHMFGIINIREVISGLIH